MIGTGLYIAKRIRQMPDRVRAELFKAEQENARDTLAVILEYSSGDISSAELAALGHPYAPGRTPPQDPAIINIQREDEGDVFIEQWRQEGPRILPNGAIETNFVNDSGHAEFLSEGTEKMIARPLAERVLEEVTPRVEERREAAIKRGVEGGLK